jgi:hypothetical protein
MFLLFLITISNIVMINPMDRITIRIEENICLSE